MPGSASMWSCAAALGAALAACAAAADVPDGEQLKGKRATLVTVAGDRHEGEITYFSPYVVFLLTGRGKEPSWLAREIDSLEVDGRRYVYNRRDNALVLSKEKPENATIPIPESGVTEPKKRRKSDTVEVVATGVGSNAEEALKDALVGAVRQVVGEIVEAETLVKDDKLISEVIVTYSKGFVTGYEELESWTQDRLVYRQISARVARDLLSEQLRNTGVQLRRFDGKNLYAQIVTQLREEKDARQLIRRTFKNYPAAVIEVRAGKPEPVEKTETDVTLGYDVSLRVDPAKYRAFVERIRPALELMARRKGTVTLKAHAVYRIDQPFYDAFLAEEARPSLRAGRGGSAVLKIDLTDAVEPWWTSDFDPEKQMVVLVNTARNPRHAVTAWNWYHLPLVGLAPGRLNVAVKFRDGDRQTVKQDGWGLGPLFPGYNGAGREIRHPKSHQRAEVSQVIVSPYLLRGEHFTTEVVLDRTLRLTLEELRTVESIECSVAAGKAAGGE